MERINNQPTFLDSLTSDLGGRRTSEFLSKCDRLIPWNELAEPLKGMYRNNTDKGGDPNYPLVMMIKCMMLQKWFNLSDPMLEEMLDSKHIDEFVENEKHSVWADSAYIDAKRKAELGRRGVFCGIIQKRVRGQKELTPSQKWHNRLVASIHAIVEHPFAWIKNTGHDRTRYRGMRRNVFDFGLHVIAYN